MDRSFLSDANVVAASRDFVCIRLTTYEDQAEADFLKTIYVGKSGDLENTTFAILSADGKTKLTKTGRAPFHEYRNGQSMAAGMQEIAKSNKVQAETMFTDTKLPFTKNLEIGLNVAASDGLPLVVIVADDEKQLTALSENALSAAWSKSVAGQFVYAAVLDQDQLKPITGRVTDSGAKQVAEENWNGILIVEPDQFGVSGKVLAKLAVDSDSEAINKAFNKTIVSYPHKVHDHQAHVQLGIELGLDWESEIPETDPESLRAKERARGK